MDTLFVSGFVTPLTVTNFYPVYYYLVSFWTVVVMNCAKPANWEYCLPIHVWLLPEIVNHYERIK